MMLDERVRINDIVQEQSKNKNCGGDREEDQSVKLFVSDEQFGQYSADRYEEAGSRFANHDCLGVLFW